MEKTRVIISGIGEYQPPWKLDNQYLFDKYISLVDQRLFIRNAIEILRGGFLAKKQTEAIRVLESDRGFGIKSRYWEVLPEDDDFPVPDYPRIKSFKELLRHPETTRFSKGWSYITEQLKLSGAIDPASHTDSAMAFNAGQMAVQTADIDPARIGGVIHATATPDATGGYSAANRIAHSLGVSDQAFTYDLVTGCCGVMDAVFLAHSFLSQPDAGYDAVLVTGSNLTSARVKAFLAEKPKGWRAHYSYPGVQNALLFGDGAGAFILQRVPDNDCGILHIKKAHRAIDNPAFLLEGGSALPMTKNGLRLSLEQYYVHSKKVFKNVARIMEETAEQTVDEAEAKSLGRLHPRDADLVVAHQPSRVTLESVRKKLEIDREKMADVLETRGNLVATSVPTAMFSALDRLSPGNILHLIGIGAGWHVAHAIIRVGPEIEKMKSRARRATTE